MRVKGVGVQVSDRRAGRAGVCDRRAGRAGVSDRRAGDHRRGRPFPPAPRVPLGNAGPPALSRQALRCGWLWGGASVTAVTAPGGDQSGGRALGPLGLISDAARGAQPGGAEGLEPA